MITENNKNLAQWAMDFAKANGCQGARINLYSGSNSTLEVRDMKIDKLGQASENSLSVHLFVDGRYGSVSTNRLDKKELEKLIRNGIDSVRFLSEDKARTLPDASLYYKGNDDPQLFDNKFDSIQPDDKVTLAMNVCNEMMDKDSRIISVESSFSNSKGASYMIASNGFEGGNSFTSYSVSAGVSIKGEGEARPQAGWYDATIFFDSLQKEGIGTTALERVIRKLGQKKTASGKYAMLVDNINSSNLIYPLIGALYGASIQQKNSFLVDKLNQQVLGGNITLMDEPHLPQEFGTRYFDGEGIATRRQPVFENGVLKTYFIDTYYGNKMGIAPTISSPSILTMPLGSRDLDGIAASLDKAILVTGFNGGNSNSTTGDFSYGIEGFLIQKGKLTQPISEMNITGNFLTLWNNLKEAGNDLRKSSNWKIPSLLFEGVDFSGL
ncbi:MAG: TldD/PmbA family protein [Cytophagaceae bacterium]|jgi:PmbA protein|nr:TldD/PmbA family protein [Cytophagaceae bacterium]